MMLAGNIGLLAAIVDLLPDLKERIQNSLSGHSAGIAPWDA
jgi:hypothetical protein